MSTLDTPQMNNVSPRPTGIQYGFIAALISIALGLVASTAGLIDYTQQNSAGNWIISLLNYAIIIGALVMGMKKHREDLGGYMTFGQGFMVGLWATLIMAVITLVWTYINFSFIESDAISTMMEATRDQMIDRGMSDADIDQAMQFTSWMMNPTMLSIFGAVGSLIGGLIISLIVAAIMQRKPPVDAAV